MTSIVRKAAAAGTFYPANPSELVKTMAELFSKVTRKTLPGRPLALVAPHAGYAYSGKTAATAYMQILGENYDSVVVISPSHTVFFQGASVYDGDAYETPLGPIEIDRELSARIGTIHPSVFLSTKGHSGGGLRGEHALEVHLPFLQHVLGKFKLVAIVMGEQEENLCRIMGEVLATALDGKNALIVASTDLSHFYPEKQARRLDGAIQSALEEFNSDKLWFALSSGKGEACGGGPVISAMLACKRLGGDRITILDYSTSGEATGDFTEVVGYLSAAITTIKPLPRKEETPRENGTANNLTVSDKKYLLETARNTIAAKIHNQPSPEDIPDSKTLRDKRGAFVTLKIGGNLRGCIGMIRAARPLYETVREMALAAAFDDPRFEALTPAEVEKISLEISALSPLVRVRDLNDIEVGRDGLMIRLDFHSGLLLPQVATEHNWDKTTFLEQTCLKAGLPKNIYKDKNAEIYRFTADVF